MQFGNSYIYERNCANFDHTQEIKILENSIDIEEDIKGTIGIEVN